MPLGSLVLQILVVACVLLASLSLIKLGGGRVGGWMLEGGVLPQRQAPVSLVCAYALMASAAGIRMPESRLLEISTPKGKRALFAVQRFDRPVDGSRLHLHTLAGLRHIHHQAPGFSYEIIADTLLRITGDRRELRELARRAAFNILAGNRNDHAKNFSLLMDSTGQWSQSPAYDITSSPGPGRQGIHVASLNGSVTPTKQDFLSFAKRASVNEAEEIFQNVSDAVHNWPGFAKQAGLRDANIKNFSQSHRCL